MGINRISYRVYQVCASDIASIPEYLGEVSSLEDAKKLVYNECENSYNFLVQGGECGFLDNSERNMVHPRSFANNITHLNHGNMVNCFFRMVPDRDGKIHIAYVEDGICSVSYFAQANK